MYTQTFAFYSGACFEYFNSSSVFQNSTDTFTPHNYLDWISQPFMTHIHIYTANKHLHHFKKCLLITYSTWTAAFIDELELKPLQLIQHWGGTRPSCHVSIICLTRVISYNINTYNINTIVIMIGLLPFSASYPGNLCNTCFVFSKSSPRVSCPILVLDNDDCS